MAKKRERQSFPFRLFEVAISRGVAALGYQLIRNTLAMLHDSFEERLDLPTASIEVGDRECRQGSHPRWISSEGRNRLFTVQVDDRRNHGKLLALHSFTHAYREDIRPLLKGVLYESSYGL